MTDQLYFAPCKSYSGKTIVRKLGMTTDTRGQQMVMVQALNGEPWSDWTSGGYAMTNRAKFYPEHVTPVNENATTGIVTLSTFNLDQLADAIVSNIRSAK